MPARRLLLAGFAFALAYWALAGVALLVLDSPVLARWMGLSGLLAAAVTAALHRLLTRSPPGDGPGPDPGGEGGGGGGSPPAGDPPPPWWPEFEREFRAHVERAGHPRTPV